MITRGVAGSVLVLLGSLVVSVLPASTPLLSLDGLRLLREHEVGRMLGLTMVMVGLGLLGHAWLTLCRRVSSLGHDPSAEVVLVRVAAAAWSAPLLIAPPLFSRDGWSYAAQGMMTRVGLSPYDYGPGVLTGPIIEAVDPRWLATGTPYGPLPLMYGGLASRLTGDPWLLVLAHRGCALVGLALLVWAVPRLARWGGVNPALATAIVAASPLMLANGVGGLHNDLLMVGLMAAALVVGVERSWVYGGLLGGAAAAVKLPGGLVCVGIALAAAPAGASLWRRLRALASVGAVASGFLLLLGLVAGLGVGWVGMLAVPGTVNTPMSMPTVVGGFLDLLARWLGLGLRPATFLDLVRQGATLASLAVVGWVALRWPTGRPDRALHGVATVMGLTLLLAPVVHPWYFLWVVPLVAPLSLPRLGALWLLAVSVVIGLVAPLDSSLHGAYLAIIVGVLCCAAATVALLLTRRSRRKLGRIVDADGLAVP